MRTVEEVARVLSLIAAGLNDCEIERRTGIPRRTILGWRNGRVPRFARSGARRSCKQCGHPAHDFAALPMPAYAYLLGIYLGDGMVSDHGRSHRLTIFLDRKYPRVVRECRTAMATVMPTSKVSLYQRPNERTDEVYSYSKAWPCLLPQHGPGKKHTRRIQLVSWQRELIEKQPGGLVRGLIHSDGCRHLNTIRHPKKTYAYYRYEFTNLSADIRRIFCDACNSLGIEWRVMNAKTISVARRDSVSVMDRHVGQKR